MDTHRADMHLETDKKQSIWFEEMRNDPDLRAVTLHCSVLTPTALWPRDAAGNWRPACGVGLNSKYKTLLLCHLEKSHKLFKRRQSQTKKKLLFLNKTWNKSPELVSTPL